MHFQGAALTETIHLSIAERADYRPYIDGWRGIAILLVMMVHTSQHFGDGVFLFDWCQRLFISGARGVQLFFILSAFTLFNSSYRRFKNDVSPKRDFYLRRAFRILPLWFLVIATYCLLDSKPLWVAGLNATFLFGFVRFNESLEVVSGGWSLFVEETFYLLLPLIFGKVSSLRRASNFTIVLMFIAVAWSSAGFFKVKIPDARAFSLFFPANQWYFFGMGIMLYYILSNQSLRLGESTAKWKWDLSAFCLMPVMLSYYLSAIGVMFAFCIYVSSHEGTLLNRITNNTLLRRFGVYCYSIYLLHFLVLRFCDPFLRYLAKLLSRANVPVEVWFLIAFPVVAAICLFIGYFSFNLIEKPSVKFGKRVILKLGHARQELAPKVSFAPVKPLDDRTL